MDEATPAADLGIPVTDDSLEPTGWPSSRGEDAVEPTTVEQAGSEKSAVPEVSSPRFHDMDSLRAAMMLLGLVFHAAWFFQPFYFGNTLSDSGASTGFLYFFAWVHQFRMQVFFLIAGFFACLLIKKRGHIGFAKNRFMRIVVPLGLAMLTIWPLMKLQYLRGGLVSGRILSDEPLLTQYWNSLLEAAVGWRNEWIMHLWFLQCLILIYAIALVLRLLFDYVFDRHEKVRPLLESITNRVTLSHWGPVLLAIPVAVCMAYDLTWFGIDSGPIKPLWAGVFAYWIFFAVGWCLHASPQIIDVFVRRWPTYFVLGSLLSLALCGYFHKIMVSGRIIYPVIFGTEIDYPSLRAHLLQSAESPEESAAHRVVWDMLSPTYREFVRRRENPTSDQLAGFTNELSTVTVFNPAFPARLEGRVPTEADIETHDPVANRELMAQRLGGDVFGRWQCPLWIKASYFYIYGLASWIMTFAMLGLFRRYLSHPSASIRYLADSSYWLYLIHLPLQFEISIQLGLWQANGIFKFVIYNLLTFAILLPTYHYFVRPTWLGYLLNGRLYPLHTSRLAKT